MKKSLVVLDTNLFIAGFWNPGSASAWIIRQCIVGALNLVYTPAIKRELDRIMRQVGVTSDYREDVNRLFEKSCLVNPEAAAATTEDRDDQKFLDCAAGSEADYIITSDRHLLTLRQLGVTRILTPSEFRREAENETPAEKEGQ